MVGTRHGLLAVASLQRFEKHAWLRPLKRLGRVAHVERQCVATMSVGQVADEGVSETEALALRMKEVLGHCNEMEAFGVTPDETLPIPIVTLCLHAAAFTTAQS